MPQGAGYSPTYKADTKDNGFFQMCCISVGRSTSHSQQKMQYLNDISDWLNGGDVN